MHALAEGSRDTYTDNRDMTRVHHVHPSLDIHVHDRPPKPGCT